MPLMTLEECKEFGTLGISSIEWRSDINTPTHVREAYRISLAKWSLLYHNAVADYTMVLQDGGAASCGFCMMYRMPDMSLPLVPGSYCRGCPIRTLTNDSSFCDDNEPYHRYVSIFAHSMYYRAIDINGPIDPVFANDKASAAQACLDEIDLIDRAMELFRKSKLQV